MFVRALYDYSTDDPTSLSFRAGDVIQVLKQLDSGWWDGIVNGLPMEGTNLGKTDITGLWVPQATPHGRLFYFNLETAEIRQELPLEAPTSTTESGPRDRSQSIPDQTRPPPEILARGYERDEPPYQSRSDDEDSASERESDMLVLNGASASVVKKRKSGDRTSDAPTSLGGFTGAPDSTSPGTSHSISNSLSVVAKRRDMYTGTPKLRATVYEFYKDVGPPMPETWDELIEKTSIAVERFRRVINSYQHAKYSQRAEQIADWLCLVIASGSGTTDTHSVQPSVIARKKELMPHFRHFMAAFSKLILSSSVASTDCGPPDTETKCLTEADEVLVGLFGYADVAKEITGERIPRIKPGFIKGSTLTEGWKPTVKSLASPETPGSPKSPGTPHTPIEQSPAGNKPGHLDSALVEAMEKLDGIIRPAIVKLEASLTCEHQLITAAQQQTIGTNVVQAAQKVFEAMRRYFALLNGVNMLPQAESSPTLVDFEIQKQRLRDSHGELAAACMNVTAPLSDEWISRRGESMEERLNAVRQCIRDLEGGIRQLNFTTQLLVGELETLGPKTDERRWNQPTDLSPRSRHQRQSSRQLNPPRGSIIGVNREGQPSKISRVLGEQPVRTEPQPPPPAVQKYLQCDHDNEIVYGAKGQVKGGTLAALVERLTRHDMLDSGFNTTFLLTYPSFATSSELFTQLAKRFTMQPPAGIQGADYDFWVEKKQRLVRMRVLSILKLWLESNWMEATDKESKEVLRSMHNFAKDVMLPVLPGTSVVLSLIETRLRGQEPENKRLILTMPSQPPPPILPRNMRRLKFLDIDQLEFARQLTIIEARSYAKLRVVECLSKGWSKPPAPGAKDPAENIRAIIMQSNQLTNWVAEMILAQTDARKRVVVIKHFIGVAEKCRQLNNFSTLTAILAALQTASIHRLRRTWEHVPAKSQITLEGLNRLMGATMNFAEYREMLHIVNPPCVPFLGVYLKDLTFVADGNDDSIKGTELINFGKRVKAANIISEIQQYQAVPYGLTPVPELQDYIISSMQAARDVNEMYAVSLSLEPREREDEKIAR
ncbi:ras guanine nucleotide exchange factor domain-containing protein [Sphaerosporella brunnea]|uniref:Ras guanine nucleotide exchange factor domain-containing protein n=1 Tax=Sphaerosporella brunnea TaxID=1250544 RepID=A0A5J5F8B0_9PEZI|nr:ras guanine nucleotide exchange factor domain-containing protein [Sphaerosporella brunnea]